MQSTSSAIVPESRTTRRAAPANARPQPRVAASPSLDEAYEMRLLAEVARWDDQAAFEQLYARHRAVVVRVALHICHDAGAAEEIAQHAFTSLWLRADRLIAKSVRLRPWLTTVARNAAIDHLRAERPAASLAAAVEIPSPAPSPEDVALTDETKAELARALGRLSGDQRAAIELVFISGLTYAAAAAALGEPIGTVKSRVRLGIGHLRAGFASR